jgi:hypothetical protein
LGAYDTIKTHPFDTRFYCSEGHHMPGLQSKDFGETLGRVVVVYGHDCDLLMFQPGNGSEPGYVSPDAFGCHGYCHRCPSFTTFAGTELKPWVEFKVERLFARLAVRRISSDYATWLAQMRANEQF